MYLLLAVFLLTLLWLPIQTAVSVKVRRIPSVFWWLGPALLAAFAGIGIDTALGDATAAVPGASPANRQLLIAKGASVAMNIAAFGGIVVALLSTAIAWGAGLANLFRAKEGAKRSWGRGLAGVGVAGLAASWLLFRTATSELGVATMATPGLLLFATLGATLSALHTGAEESTGAHASDRLAASLGVVGAVAGSAVAAASIGLIDAFMALEGVRPEKREPMMERAFATLSELGDVGLAATVVAVLVAVIVTTAETEGLRSRRFAVETGLSLLLFFPAVGTGWLAKSQIDAFRPLFNRAMDPGNEGAASDGAREGEAPEERSPPPNR